MYKCCGLRQHGPWGCKKFDIVRKKCVSWVPVGEKKVWKTGTSWWMSLKKYSGLTRISYYKGQNLYQRQGQNEQFLSREYQSELHFKNIIRWKRDWTWIRVILGRLMMRRIKVPITTMAWTWRPKIIKGDERKRIAIIGVKWCRKDNKCWITWWFTKTRNVKTEKSLGGVKDLIWGLSWRNK